MSAYVDFVALHAWRAEIMKCVRPNVRSRAVHLEPASASALHFLRSGRTVETAVLNAARVAMRECSYYVDRSSPTSLEIVTWLFL